MRACKQCGLSMGDTATFCQVCGALAEPRDVAPPAIGEPTAAGAKGTDGTPTASDVEAEARRHEKTDPARAATLYRQAIVGYLDSSEDPLASRSARGDVQRAFDRLSLVLKREGLVEEALEEIDSAAYLGLVDDDCGTKARRDALVKRRAALSRALSATAAGKS